MNQIIKNRFQLFTFHTISQFKEDYESIIVLRWNKESKDAT